METDRSVNKRLFSRIKTLTNSQAICVFSISRDAHNMSRKGQGKVCNQFSLRYFGISEMFCCLILPYIFTLRLWFLIKLTRNYSLPVSNVKIAVGTFLCLERKRIPEKLGGSFIAGWVLFTYTCYINHHSTNDKNIQTHKL